MENWVHINELSGQGSKELTVIVDPNNSSKWRQTQITGRTLNGITDILTIIQKGSNMLQNYYCGVDLPCSGFGLVTKEGEQLIQQKFVGNPTDINTVYLFVKDGAYPESTYFEVCSSEQGLLHMMTFKEAINNYKLYFAQIDYKIEQQDFYILARDTYEGTILDRLYAFNINDGRVIPPSGNIKFALNPWNMIYSQEVLEFSNLIDVSKVSTNFFEDLKIESDIIKQLREAGVLKLYAEYNIDGTWHSDGDLIANGGSTDSLAFFGYQASSYRLRAEISYDVKNHGYVELKADVTEAETGATYELIECLIQFIKDIN